jgi:hypothetical protein
MVAEGLGHFEIRGTEGVASLEAAQSEGASGPLVADERNRHHGPHIKDSGEMHGEALLLVERADPHAPSRLERELHQGVCLGVMQTSELFRSRAGGSDHFECVRLGGGDDQGGHVGLGELLGIFDDQLQRITVLMAG